MNNFVVVVEFVFTSNKAAQFFCQQEIFDNQKYTADLRVRILARSM